MKTSTASAAHWPKVLPLVDDRPVEADRMLLAFCDALRTGGVGVSHERSAAWLRAVAIVGIGDHCAVRCAGRATLCSSLDEVQRFDSIFDTFFFGEPLADSADAGQESQTRRHGAVATPSSEDNETDLSRMVGYASAVEVLRHRDVASLDTVETAILNRMIGGLACRAPLRRSRRQTSSRSGPVDGHRTLRLMTRNHGEIVAILRRRPAARTRNIVVLLDISHSMNAYSEAFLRLAHRYVSTVPCTEVFTLGTRLTRITPALRSEDPELALAHAGTAVPDWAGGTRLGDTLKAFLDRWGQRGLARGAVVLVLSDGWERGDTTLLGEQAARLRRVCYRTVWVNPHRGKTGYEPQQSGIVAILPSVDEFVAGHTQEAFERLCATVSKL